MNGQKLKAHERPKPVTLERANLEVYKGAKPDGTIRSIP